MAIRLIKVEVEQPARKNLGWLASTNDNLPWLSKNKVKFDDTLTNTSVVQVSTSKWNPATLTGVAVVVDNLDWLHKRVFNEDIIVDIVRRRNWTPNQVTDPLDNLGWLHRVTRFSEVAEELVLIKKLNSGITFVSDDLSWLHRTKFTEVIVEEISKSKWNPSTLTLVPAIVDNLEWLHKNKFQFEVAEDINTKRWNPATFTTVSDNLEWLYKRLLIDIEDRNILYTFKGWQPWMNVNIIPPSGAGLRTLAMMGIGL